MCHISTVCPFAKSKIQLHLKGKLNTHPSCFAYTLLEWCGGWQAPPEAASTKQQQQQQRREATMFEKKERKRGKMKKNERREQSNCFPFGESEGTESIHFSNFTPLFKHRLGCTNVYYTYECFANMTDNNTYHVRNIHFQLIHHKSFAI